MTIDCIPARFLQQAVNNPNLPAYAERVDGQWIHTNWDEYVSETRKVARALIALDVHAGDKVCLLGFNRPEWQQVAMATMLCGAVPVGIYTTCSPEEVQYIIQHSDAKLILLENPEQWAKISNYMDALPTLQKALYMRGDFIEEENIISWRKFLSLSEKASDSDIDYRLADIRGESLGSLIYTSGTTGPTKGVMLTHKNLLWTALAIVKEIDANEEDRFLSFLPLCHIAEQMCSLHGAACTGHTIYFAESLEKVPDNIKEVQPSVFFAVPRVWEKFHAAVSEKLQGATGFKKHLVAWAMGVAKKINTIKIARKNPNLWLTLQYKLADKLLLSKVKPALGLGNARLCTTGGAPISPELLEWFTQLDITILEVYGQSEAAGATTLTKPDWVKFGSVGRLLPGLDAKIADDNEILFRGPSIFSGYYKDQEETSRTLVGGWMHSGDLGEIDEDGFVTLTGRKKDIIITAGGKNISPKNIEDALMSIECVSQAVVIGDRRNFLSALLTISPDVRESYAQQFGVAPDELERSKPFVEMLQNEVDAVNKRFARVENIRKYLVLAEEFSVTSGELTPTLKIRRKVIIEKYASVIDAMYEEAKKRDVA